MRKISHERINKLSGFKKGHFEPKEINYSANSFVQQISETEISEEIQFIYEKTKSILQLKRNQIQKASDIGGGSVETEFFRYFIEIEQDNEDPKYALFKRRLQLRVSKDTLPEEFPNIFPVQPDILVLPIEGELDFDDLVNKFEDLEKATGGKLKENDENGVIQFTTKENLKIEIHTYGNEFIISNNKKLNCLELLEFSKKELTSIMNKTIKFLD